MSEQKITANYNFIRNGDFQNDLEDGWTLNDPAKVSKQMELWEGNPTAHMRLVNEGIAEQTFTLRSLPRPTVNRAVYRVSFYYQATQGAVCWVALKPGKGGRQQYDLIPSFDLREGEDPGVPEEPLELHLTLMERDIQLTADENEVTVEFGSPANDRPGMLRGLRVTLVKVELLLEDLRLEQVWLDDAEQDRQGPLRLCLGATAEHAATLRLKPADDSVWMGTDVGLLVDGAIPDPGAPVSVSPGGEHPIENPWLISCADLPDEEGVTHSLLIESAYTANRYALETLSGHFRVDVVSEHEATYFPVIDLGQTVELIARVQSHYTGLPLAGREVIWSLGENELFRGTTDDGGKVRFNYEPDVAGLRQIIAKVDSFYKPEDAQYAFEVRALQSDPWLDIQVALDGLAPGQWDSNALYPYRGGAHEIRLMLPADSPLLDTHLSLLSVATPDTPESLGVTFDPPLGEPHPQTAALMRWAMDCGDWKDGLFSLQLDSSRLLAPSSLKPLNLAHNKVEKGWVKEATRFPSLDSPPLPLAIQVKSTIAGVPEARDVEVLWVLEADEEKRQTGTDGVSEYEFKPTVEGTFEVKAKVNNRYDETSVTHDFRVTVLGEDPWQKLATLTMNDKEPGAIGIYAFLEDEGLLRLMPSGEGLLNQEIYLIWSDINPDLGFETDPPMAQKQWDGLLLTSAS